MIARIAGCSAGTLVYGLARTACHARNRHRPLEPLPAAVRTLMRPHFPALDLAAVRVCRNASLPPNWFALRRDVAGMAFGNTIFMQMDDYTRSARGLRLLMHELVHVDQVRRAGGERAFACAYGRGYLQGGGYRGNPLEEEAYAFVAEFGASLPDGLPGGVGA